MYIIFDILILEDELDADEEPGIEEWLDDGPSKFSQSINEDATVEVLDDEFVCDEMPNGLRKLEEEDEEDEEEDEEEEEEVAEEEVTELYDFEK